MMRRTKLALALLFGVQIVCWSDVSFAQLLNRSKDRRPPAKESEAPARLVAQPGVNAPNQNASAAESSDAPPSTDRNRLKPTPLPSAPPVSVVPKPPAKAAAPPAAPVAKPDQVNAVAAIPRVSIETIGPAEVNLGRRAKYTITVRNDGESVAQGLLLQVDMPAGAELVASDPKPEQADSRLEYLLEDLEAKGVRKLHLELIPRQHGSMVLKTHAYVSTATTAAVQVRRPEMVVKFEAPTEAVVGDKVVFKAIITNTGDGPADDISLAQLETAAHGDEEIKLTEAVLETEHTRIERLLPGESEEVELPAMASDAGLLRASIVVKSIDGLEVQGSADVMIRKPAIEIKTIGPESRAVQRSGGYVILVTNVGDVAAEHLVVTAALPKGLEVVGIEKRTMLDRKLSILTWNLAKVEPGVTESLKFQVKALGEGEHLVQVVATGDRNLSAQSEHVVRVTGKADLALTVEDAPGPFEVGGQATYEIRVKNCGTKVMQRVGVRCTLPRGLAVESSPEFRLNGLNLDFSPIHTLGVGEEKVLRLTVTGREPGDHVVRFELMCDSVSREIVAETSTFFFKP
jgi:uncharacterized repeat protein (TIGR01451 family)